MTEQEVADRARPYVTAAGTEAREDDLLTASRRALCEAAALCNAEEAPDCICFFPARREKARGRPSL